MTSYRFLDAMGDVVEEGDFEESAQVAARASKATGRPPCAPLFWRCRILSEGSGMTAVTPRERRRVR